MDRIRDYEALMKYLDCPCEFFPSMNDTWPAHAAYLQELWHPEANCSYTPVLIAVTDELFDLIDFTSNKREDLLLAPLPDGRKLLEDRLAQAKLDRVDFYKNEDEWAKKMVGKMKDGFQLQLLLSGWKINMVQSHPMILAKIPTGKPWEIFAWLPFGGWNNNPSVLEHMAISKYWYEKYQAQPIIISGDTIEYRMEEAVKKKAALELANEQYAYCQDIVDQGTYTIGKLADCLHRSRSWYFWWD